jgi:hypothetical protein
MEWFKSFLGIASDIEAVYWILAITSTALFLLKIFFNFGDEHEGDGVVSLSSILSFLKVGAWMGVLCFRLTDFSVWTILLVTLLSGSMGFIGAVWVLRRLRGLESSGTLSLENAVGKIGTVYCSLPNDKNDVGQIQVEVQGRLATLNAKSDGVEIKTGSKVLVYGVENGALLVEPYSGDEN